jgi:hypothetical protein
MKLFIRYSFPFFPLEFCFVPRFPPLLLISSQINNCPPPTVSVTRSPLVMCALPYASTPLFSWRFSSRSTGLLLSWCTLTSYLKASEDGSDLSVTKSISNIFSAKSFKLIRFEIIYKYYFSGITNPFYIKFSLFFINIASWLLLKSSKIVSIFFWKEMLLFLENNLWFCISIFTVIFGITYGSAVKIETHSSRTTVISHAS